MMSGYPTFMNILLVDGLSIDPREMGCHISCLCYDQLADVPPNPSLGLASFPHVTKLVLFLAHHLKGAY